MLRMMRLILTSSQFQEVSEELREVDLSVIDKVKDEVEHLKIK